MNHKRNKSIKENKTEVITIRIAPDAKKKLKKKASSNESTLSEYLIAQGLGSKVPPDRKNKEDIFSSVIVQQICSYVAETYGEDKTLEGWCRRLWENL